MKSKKIIVFLLIINFILLGIIFNLISKNGNIIKNRQLIKEMTSSTLETQLNSQITALNAEHTEYMQHIQTCKTQIASALTDMGVETSDQETLEIMANNIKKITTDTGWDFSNYTKLASDQGGTYTVNMTEGVINCVNGEGLRDKLILKNGANYLILQIKSEYNAYSVTECTETTITLKGGTYSMFTAFGIE